MSDETIQCRRCHKQAPAIAKPPFRNELGERIHREICADCWKDWLQHQTLLINHYGLDPREAKARAFLYQQTQQVLFGDEDAEQVDTSKKGTIEW